MKAGLTTNQIRVPRDRTGAAPNAPSKHDSQDEAICNSGTGIRFRATLAKGWKLKSNYE